MGIVFRIRSLALRAVGLRSPLLHQGFGESPLPILSLLAEGFGMVAVVVVPAVLPFPLWIGMVSLPLVLG